MRKNESTTSAGDLEHAAARRRETAQSLRRFAGVVHRRGLSAERFAALLPEFRKDAKYEVPAELLRVVAAARAQKLTANQLAARLLREARQVELGETSEDLLDVGEGSPADRLRRMAAIVRRHGLDSRAWAQSLREFRQVGKNETPAVLLELAARVDAEPWRSPGQLEDLMLATADAIDRNPRPVDER